MNKLLLLLIALFTTGQCLCKDKIVTRTAWESSNAINLTKAEDFNYHAWPWNNLKLDSKGDAVFFYTAGPLHVPTSGDTSVASHAHVMRMRKIPAASSLVINESTPNPVTAAVTLPAVVGEGLYVQAWDQLASGRYVVIASRLLATDGSSPQSYRVDREHYYYYSDDFGATWTNDGFVKATTGSAPTGSWAVGALTLSDGSFIFANGTHATKPFQIKGIWKSDDGANNFRRINDGGAITPYANTSQFAGEWTWEMNFYEYKPGKILALTRGSQAPVGSISKYAIMSHSSDFGETWQPWRDVKGLVQTANPQGTWYHEDTDNWEVVLGSREGGGGLYQSYSGSGSGGLAGAWKPRSQFYTATANLPSQGRDFGYPSIVRAGTNMFTVFYDHGSTGHETDVYLIMGNTERVPLDFGY